MKPSRWLAFATILVASVRTLVTTSATEGAAGDEAPMRENFVKYAGADKPDGFRVYALDKTSSGSFRPRLVPSIAKKNVVHVKLDVY